MGARRARRWPPPIDRAYFVDYCGRGPYDEQYLHHSGIEHCISIVGRTRLDVRSVVVLGAATGRVLTHFHDAWGVRARGCEISRWAHSRIPARDRARIERRDMRRYVRDLVRRRRSFDLCFTNSLVYLEAGEIPSFVDACSRISGHLHFLSSTAESRERGDRYRVTTRSTRWWRSLFVANGFEPTRSPYLWRSTRRGSWR